MSAGTLDPARPSDEQLQAAKRALTALGVLGSTSLVGVAFSLWLVNHAPLVLVALSPLGRHLILVAPLVDPFALTGVLVVRRILFYGASFELGRAMGPAALPWIEARTPRFARFVRWLERLFARAPRLVSFAMTGPTVAVLAGVSGMRLRTYAALASAGLVLRMIFLLLFADWVREYLEIALAWIDAYWLPGTVVMVIVVAVYRWRRRAPIRVMED